MYKKVDVGGPVAACSCGEEFTFIIREDRHLFAKSHARIQQLITEIGASAGRLKIIGHANETGAQIHHDGIVVMVTT